MSGKTNNKKEVRKPSVEEVSCQTTTQDEKPTQKLSQVNTGETKPEKSIFTKKNPDSKTPTEWYERGLTLKLRDIFIELIFIIALNSFAGFLGFKEPLSITLVSIACVLTVFIVITCLLKNRKYKETVCTATEKAANKVEGLCDAIKNYKTETHEYINHSENRHIKIVSSTKRLIISKRKRPRKDESKFICKLEYSMTIYNYSNSTFENYIYDISSSQGVSQDKGYTVNIGSDIHKGLSDFNQMRYDITYSNGDVRNGLKIALPVAVESKKAKTVTFTEHDSPSFNKISNCEIDGFADDWLSISIYYPTDILSFELILDESMKMYQFLKKDRYIIPKTGEFTPDSCTTCSGGLILDRSDQVVSSERTALDNKEIAQPEYSKEDEKWSGYNRISWHIPDPKIGCRYQLFFTLSKNRKQ